MSLAYAYLHCRPEGTPFYVGKGTKARLNSLIRRNTYYENVVNKYGSENILKGFLECSSDKIAFELEMGTIKCLKRMGVKLTNMTDGGEGFEKGHSLSDATKAKMSRSRTGLKRSLEARQNMSLSAKGKKMSVEAKENMSLAHKGIAYPEGRVAWNKGGTSWNQGIETTTQAKLKMRTAMAGRVWVNNGVETKMVYKDNIPSGFKLGRNV